MPPMNITQIEQARAEYMPSSTDAQSLIPDLSAHGGYNPAEVRAEFEGRLAEIQAEFERPIPGRHTPPARGSERTWGAPLNDEQRAAAERGMLAKSQMIRHRGRLPIDDAIKIPTPPTPPPTRPAATFQTVIPTDHTSRDDQGAAPLACDGKALPKGMLDREIKIPRPGLSLLEDAAQGCYATLTHEARLLIRLLDTAQSVAACWQPSQNFWCVPWSIILDCFTLQGDESWEGVATLWRAVDELIESQIACIIPGAAAGMQALFISEHCHRQMLRSRVLAEPHSIPLVSFGYHTIPEAQASLRTRSAA